VATAPASASADAGLSSEREAALLAEIGRLKAQLLAARQERDAAVEDANRARREALEAPQRGGGEAGSGEPPLRPLHAAPKSFHAPSLQPAPKDAVGLAGGAKDGQERVTLLRDEYEALVAECGAQELLLAGFQKENEKLVAAARAREAEDTSVKARYFDQQVSNYALLPSRRFLPARGRPTWCRVLTTSSSFAPVSRVRCRARRA
jgi:uncharacterized small protein (DUF1192 family)